MWIVFVFAYAILIGFYQISRKKSLTYSSAINIVTMVTTVAFICACWMFGEAITIEPKFIGLLALKGCCVFGVWFCSLIVFKNIDLSKATIIQNSSVILVFLSGIVIFNETITILQIIGSVLIMLGVFFTSWNKDKTKRKTELKYVLLAIFVAFCSASCSLIDKFTLDYITPYQMQFWFLFFCLVYCWIIIGIVSIKQKSFTIKCKDFKNYWIYIAGVLLACADILLFNSYSMDGSKLSIIIVISKTSIIVSVIGGILIFKEKNIWWKIFCLFLIFAGALLVAL